MTREIHMTMDEVLDVAVYLARQRMIELGNERQVSGAAGYENVAQALTALRIRLAEQREELVKVREQMASRRSEDHTVTVVVYMPQWLAALDRVIGRME